MALPNVVIGGKNVGANKVVQKAEEHGLLVKQTLAFSHKKLVHVSVRYKQYSACIKSGADNKSVALVQITVVNNVTTRFYCANKKCVQIQVKQKLRKLTINVAESNRYVYVPAIDEKKYGCRKVGK